MNVKEQVDHYIDEQAPKKREDLQILHRTILGAHPSCKLWYLDGRNTDGKVVSNPNIGYGSLSRRYADGQVRDFYQIGLSANTSGISIYFIGIDDKKYLSETYGKRLGKATITGYCVKFRHLRDVNLSTVEEMVANHMAQGVARVA